MSMVKAATTSPPSYRSSSSLGVPEITSSKALISVFSTLNLGFQPDQGSQTLLHIASISLSLPPRVGRPCRAQLRGQSPPPSPPSSNPPQGRTPCLCPWKGLPRRQLYCSQLQGGRISPDKALRCLEEFFTFRPRPPILSITSSTTYLWLRPWNPYLGQDFQDFHLV